MSMNVCVPCPGILKFKTHAFAESAPIQTFTAVIMPQFVGFASMNCGKESLSLNTIVPPSPEMF